MSNIDRKTFESLWKSPHLKKSDFADFDISAVEKSDQMSKRQLLWHLLHDVKLIPKCQIEDCNNQVKWHPAIHCYQTFCSNKCSNRSQSKIEKSQQTMLCRYGVKHALQSEEFKVKSKTTLQKNYGVDNPSKSTEILRQTKQTNLKRYGTEHPVQSDIIKDKISDTVYKKYGQQHFYQTDVYKEKYKNTMKLKHGVDHYSKTDKFKNQMTRDNLKYWYSYSQITSDILFDKDKFTNFAKDKTQKQMANMLDVDPTTVRNYIRDYNIIDYLKNSYIENEMSNLLNSMDISYVSNVRSVISPFELDFYLPEYQMAIEMNGDYWHSDQKLNDKNYHYNKWKMCNELGIQLIHVAECDWNNQQEKFKELIKTQINIKSKGIGARKCTIKSIDSKSARPFLEKYHLQGFVGGTAHFGAYYNDTLIGVMTFGWTRGSKTSRRFELKRWVTDNKTHPGLFSKTFKFAQQELVFDEVVSFSMNDWFTGNVYNRCGFKFVKIIPPAYYYLVDGKRTHCSNFTKLNIKRKFPNTYDANLTEHEMMNILGIHRTWDSGKIEWLWTK